MLKLFPKYAAVQRAGSSGRAGRRGAPPHPARRCELSAPGERTAGAAREKAGPCSPWHGAPCATFCGFPAGNEVWGCFHARFPLALPTGSVSFGSLSGCATISHGPSLNKEESDMQSPSEGRRTAGNAGLWGRVRIPSPFPGHCSEPLSSPLDFRGEGVRDIVRFQTPRIPTVRHLALLFHSIINFWPEGATCGQRWRCFPRGFAGPPAVRRRAPGGRGRSRRRSRGPARRRLPRHFHGATAPTSGQRLPSAGGTGAAPSAAPAAAPPRPARSGAHTVPPQKPPAKPNGAAVPLPSEVEPGWGGGTREGSATRAVPRLNTGDVMCA